MLSKFARVFKLTSKSTFKRQFCSIKYFAESHEWISYNKAKNEATIGITDFAQNELGKKI